MRKIISIIFILIFSLNVYAENMGDISVGAQGAVLMDAETGRVLWEKNMDMELPVASTTKIMTAIIAIESGKLDETAVVSKKAALTPKVRLGVNSGEEYVLKDLLYPLMLQSCNDTAVVIAEHIGGSVEGFAEMMNEKARQIGAKNTKFVTPNGLDENENHSTAYDMALISGYALENQEFRELIATESYSFSCSNKNRTFSVVNKNRLLREFEGAIGVKTGFTGKAGHCFAGAAERDGVRLISVVLASGWGNKGKEQKWIDTKKLLNYGFDNFSMKKVMEKGKIFGEVEVIASREGKIAAEAKNDGYAMLSEMEFEGITVEKQLFSYVQAPVSKGETLGYVSVYTDRGEEIFTTELVAVGDVERHDFKTSVTKLINIWLNSHIDCIL